MMLAVDIGNTNIVLGIFSDNGVLEVIHRLPSDRERSAGEYAADIMELLKVYPENCIISSVVPELQTILICALQEISGKCPITVDSIDTGLIVKNYDINKLGNDRIADAVAALSRYDPPIVIFDMGTATTMSVIDREGCFIGGMIVPGLRLSLDVLEQRASCLPHVELRTPPTLIGTDAETCMLCGAIYGTSAMIDGMTDMVEAEIGWPVTLVATGGLGRFVIPLCRRVINYDENLLLRGLHLIYRRSLGI